jgi:hypothetical protein
LRPGLEQFSQKRGDVSLRLDHLARLGEFRFGMVGTTPQLGILRLQRVRLATIATTSQRRQSPFVALLAPYRQVRRAQAFAAPQRSDLSGLHA